MKDNPADKNLEQVILIDLDVLIDTRFGVLLHLLGTDVTKLLDNGYRYRNHDDFDLLYSGVNMDEFNHLYNNRDKSILALSRLSSFMEPLIDIVKEFERELDEAPELVSGVTIVINFHPYELTNDEIEQFLVGIQSRIGVVVKLKYINEDPLNLNIPTLTYRNYTQYIMYHFNDWVAKHYTDEDKIKHSKGNPDFVILAPKICAQYKELKDNEELCAMLDTLEHGEESTFELATISFAPHFNLVYMETNAFSLIDLTQPQESD